MIGQQHTDAKEDAVILVHARNEFYKIKYYLSLGVCALSWVVIALLIVALVFLIQHPVRSLYFVADSSGRLIEDIPVTVPNMPTNEAAAWAIKAVQAAYSYDFVNYRGQLQSAQKYFTDYGWQNYIRGLNASNNLLALAQRKMVVVAQVVDKPKLEAEGMLSGAYAWKFQMPVLVTYLLPPYDDKSRFVNPLSVTVVVQRQKLLQSYKGLGIVQMIGTFVTQQPQSPGVAPALKSPVGE
jgi:intracellular multiplication protein IcmL